MTSDENAISKMAHIVKIANSGDLTLLDLGELGERAFGGAEGTNRPPIRPFLCSPGGPVPGGIIILTKAFPGRARKQALLTQGPEQPRRLPFL
jgi:hypothetical protein